MKQEEKAEQKQMEDRNKGEPVVSYHNMEIYFYLRSLQKLSADRVIRN